MNLSDSVEPHILHDSNYLPFERKSDELLTQELDPCGKIELWEAVHADCTS